MENINSQGLMRFRRWYNQYRATHGTTPPQNLVTSFLQGEIEANISKNLAADELAFRKETTEEQLNLTREQIADQKRAATISGATNLAVGGAILGKEFGLFGGPKPTGAAGITSAGTAPLSGAALESAATGPMALSSGTVIPANSAIAGLTYSGVPGGTAAAAVAGPAAGGASTIGKVGTTVGGKVAAAKAGLLAGTGYAGPLAVAAGAGYLGSKLTPGEPKVGAAAAGAAAGGFLAAGTALGGPVGAVVGGVVGLIAGDK